MPIKASRMIVAIVLDGVQGVHNALQDLDAPATNVGITLAVLDQRANFCASVSELGVDVVDNTPDCPYTHTLTERQQYHMDFIERFQFEQSHNKASVAARLDSLELRMMLVPLASSAEEVEGPEVATAKCASADQTPACAICLSDFERGEHAMVFKKCG